MFLGCSRLQFAGLVSVLAGVAGAADLRVCADPNNLPFSNQKQQGFDNVIAAMVARDLGRTISYRWAPERGDPFVRKTILSGKCDLLMGIPSAYREVAHTQPYYRSTYVFVSQRARHLNIHSLNDPALRKLRIGVHVISDDASNLPPAQALANRGIFRNIASYSMYGDTSKPNPPAALIQAVDSGTIDLAIAWGPLAGYFARHVKSPLDIAAVTPQVDRPYLPFIYSISMGVRPGDQELLRALNGFIDRNEDRIRAILLRYGVPMLDDTNRIVAAGP
jgi:mxaJ protein